MGILALACCKGTPQTACVPGAIVIDSRRVFPVLEAGTPRSSCSRRVWNLVRVHYLTDTFPQCTLMDKGLNSFLWFSL